MGQRLANIIHSVLGTALLACLLLPGCASKKYEWTLASQSKPLAFSQQFPGGYCSRNIDGNLDVVLVTDTDASLPGKKSNISLLPLAHDPMRQIVHVRVFWQPLRGTKADYPAATNAVIDWYVFTRQADGTTQSIHYSGVGFVRTYDASAAGIRSTFATPPCRPSHTAAT